jgi:hypothetical protein
MLTGQPNPFAVSGPHTDPVLLDDNGRPVRIDASGQTVVADLPGAETEVPRRQNRVGSVTEVPGTD